MQRNLAIKHSIGQVILFIGDDIYAEENFLKNISISTWKTLL